MEEIVNHEKIEAVKRMLENGTLSVDKIARSLDLPVEVVKKLANDV